MLCCAAHPARPAVDACPVCGRARCGADAAAAGGGCPTCRGGVDVAVPAVPRDLERVVRAALAATVGALAWGKVTSEYVGSTGFGDIAPAVLGVLCGTLALKAAGLDGSGPLGLRVRLVACAYALLGTAFSFVDEGAYATSVPVGAAQLLPYAASVAGALLWTLPPRRLRAAPPG